MDRGRSLCADSSCRPYVFLVGSVIRNASFADLVCSTECAKRWQHFLNPELDHSEWTPKEDKQLLTEVEKHGHNWRKIVDEVLVGRSATDAKNRYASIRKYAHFIVINITFYSDTPFCSELKPKDVQSPIFPLAQISGTCQV